MKKYRKADFIEKKNERYLYIWKDIPHWMVIDEEFHFILNKFEENIEPKLFLINYIKKFNKDEKSAKKEIMKCIRYLKEYKILSANTLYKNTEKPLKEIFNINLNITNNCNLSCKWCFNNRTKESINPDSIIKAFIDIKRFITKDTSLIVLGGEPLMEKEKLLTILDFTDKYLKKPVIILTNGTLLDNEFAGMLVRHNVEIQISLDSPFEKENDDIRGINSYRKILEGIEIAVQNKIYTIINMVFTKKNYTKIEEYLKLAFRLNVNEARFIPLRLIGMGKEYKNLLPDLYLVFQHLKIILRKNPDYQSILSRDFFTMLTHYCSMAITHKNCGIGYKYVFIDADGSVYPCPNHKTEKYNAGNINTIPLDKLFLHSEVMSNIRKDYHINNYKSCLKCYVSPWCLGDCRGEIMQNYSNINAPSFHCKEIQKLIVDLFWLISEGDNVLNRDKNNRLVSYH